MAQPGYTDFTFEIKDEHVGRLRDGLAAHYGYRDTDINGEPNPETKAQYIRRKIMQEWKSRVLKAERQSLLDAVVFPDKIDIQEGT